MSDVSAIVIDANAMLAQMRQLSQEAAGESRSSPAEFSQILEQVMSTVEPPATERLVPAQVIQSMPVQNQVTFSVEVINRVYHAAIHAYQEIENMQI